MTIVNISDPVFQRRIVWNRTRLRIRVCLCVLLVPQKPATSLFIVFCCCCLLVFFLFVFLTRPKFWLVEKAETLSHQMTESRDHVLFNVNISTLFWCKSPAFCFDFRFISRILMMFLSHICRNCWKYRVFFKFIYKLSQSVADLFSFSDSLCSLGFRPSPVLAPLTFPVNFISKTNVLKMGQMSGQGSAHWVIPPFNTMGFV